MLNTLNPFRWDVGRRVYRISAGAQAAPAPCRLRFRHDIPKRSRFWRVGALVLRAGTQVSKLC